jgi:hypothetical protein
VGEATMQQRQQKVFNAFQIADYSRIDSKQCPKYGDLNVIRAKNLVGTARRFFGRSRQHRAHANGKRMAV